MRANQNPAGIRELCLPKVAPNVLLIMTDDAGFGVSSAFGGVIPTPALRAHREGRPALYKL